MSAEYATEVAKRNAECLEQIIALLGQSFPMLEVDLSGIHADWRRELLELESLYFDDPDLCE